jgi:hypothetical protein
MPALCTKASAWKTLAGTLLLLGTLLCCPKLSECASPGEHQIKAAMIFNMMRFVDWPESALPAGNGSIDVCFTGRGAMSSAIASIQGKQVKGKNITVRSVGKQGPFSGCHVLLLSETDRSSVEAILEATKSAPFMTVGEQRSFASSGGVFGFIIHEGKVRFETNLAAAQRHKIRISAQLLKLAHTVFE